MVRYYGYYSKVSRGKRKKQNQDEWISCILESDESSKERRMNWAGGGHAGSPFRYGFYVDPEYPADLLP